MAALAQHVEEGVAMFRLHHGNADARKIDHVAPGEARFERGAVACKLARGRITAPIGEVSLRPVEGDRIKTRMQTLDDRALGDADAVGGEENALLLRKDILAEGGDIIDRPRPVGERAHIPCGIQRIAREAHAPLIALARRKFDHTFSDRRESAHAFLPVAACAAIVAINAWAAGFCTELCRFAIILA